MGNHSTRISPQTGAFSPAAVEAIREEHTLRTQGAPFWDTFRRISFFKAVGRLLLMPLTLFIPELCSISWRAARDRNEARPRALRITKGGDKVDGGTLERNALRDDLKATLKAAAKSKTSASQEHEEKIERRVWEQIERCSEKTKSLDLKKILNAACGRTRELMADFGTTHFGKPTAEWPPEQIVMEVDEENKEITFEISQKSEYSPEAKKTAVEGLGGETVKVSAVVRLSFGKGVDVRVISISGDKDRSSVIGKPTSLLGGDVENLVSIGRENKNSILPGDEILFQEFHVPDDGSIPNIKEQTVPDTNVNKVAFVKSSEKQAVRESRASSYSDADRGVEDFKDISQDPPVAVTFLSDIKTRWLDITEKQQEPSDKFYSTLARGLYGEDVDSEGIKEVLAGRWQSSGKDLFPNQIEKQNDFARLKDTFPHWSWDNKESGSFDLEQHAQIASVLLDRPIVIVSSAGPDVTPQVRRFDPSGNVTRPANLKECFHLPAQDEKEELFNELPLLQDEVPLFLRQTKGIWEICDVSPKAAEQVGVFLKDK